MSMLLEMKRVDKSFPGVRALDHVNFDLRIGEIHALLGENGAGKSTLINILAGIHTADSGEILIEGKEVRLETVESSQELGIAVVHQEIALAPNMTVAENIFLNREPRTKLGFINDGRLLRDAKELLDRMGADIDPSVETGRLSIAQQQIVEIGKALSINAKLLVLDEPTAALTQEETEKLFGIVLELKKNGVGVIYISHRLDELFKISDRVTVLRDGCYIATLITANTSRDEMVELMVGRKTRGCAAHANRSLPEVVFEANGVCTDEKLKDISIKVHKNEIVGISGIVGAGRTELLRAIFGIDRMSKGEIRLNGKKLRIREVSDAIDAGLAFVSENRKEEGLILFQTVAFNLTVCVLKEFIKALNIDRNAERQIVDEFGSKLRIKANSPEEPVMYLSGGNQQKVVLAKWLATKPKLLFLDEPTRGIDVGAKEEIYMLLDELVKNGISIVIVSSELEEIVNLSDRTYVMYEGRVTACLKGNEITQERVMLYATGGRNNESV